jgi:hypothetical protein
MPMAIAPGLLGVAKSLRMGSREPDGNGRTLVDWVGVGGCVPIASPSIAIAPDRTMNAANHVFWLDRNFIA